MLVAVRRVRPEMGFSVSGLVRSVVSAPLNIVTGVTHDVAGAAGSLVGDAFHLVGSVGGAAAGAAGQVAAPLGGAIQSLRPAAAPVVAPPSSNLPLILGAGAAGLVLVLLLTRRPAPSAAT